MKTQKHTQSCKNQVHEDNSFKYIPRYVILSSFHSHDTCELTILTPDQILVHTSFTPDFSWLFSYGHGFFFVHKRVFLFLFHKIHSNMSDKLIFLGSLSTELICVFQLHPFDFPGPLNEKKKSL